MLNRKDIYTYLVWPILICGMICISLFLYFGPEASIYWVKDKFFWRFISQMKEFSSTIHIFFVSVTAIIILEHFFPAKPGQKSFSSGFFMDFFYFLFAFIANVFILLIFLDFLYWVYDTYFLWTRIQALGELPYWVRFIWGVLLSDFLAWFHHWVRHKVSFFWAFHTIHHSQKELNLFTDFRYHFLEYVISRSINTFPLMMLMVNKVDIFWWTMFALWYPRMYHGNIKTNLGFLKYILVTPQSHRVHHSIDPKHRDCNFGVIFSIWDHIFRTQWRCYTEYPDTGIEDENFPNEQGVSFSKSAGVFVEQMIYPFKYIATKMKENKSD